MLLLFTSKMSIFRLDSSFFSAWIFRKGGNLGSHMRLHRQRTRGTLWLACWIRWPRVAILLDEKRVQRRFPWAWLQRIIRGLESGRQLATCRAPIGCRICAWQRLVGLVGAWPAARVVDRPISWSNDWCSPKFRRLAWRLGSSSARLGDGSADLDRWFHAI